MIVPSCLAGRGWRFASLCTVLVLALGCLIVSAGPKPARAGFGFSFDAIESAGTFQCGKETIHYWQFEPKNKGKGPFPGILVLHGIEGLEGFAVAGGRRRLDNAIAEEYKKILKMVASYGYVVHFAHYMDSTPQDCWPHSTRRPIARLQTSFKDSLLAPAGKEDKGVKMRFEQWMACVNKGLENLQGQNGKVDKDRIGVIGLSMGGFLATSLAVTESKTFRPKAIVVAFGGLPPQLHKGKIGPLPPILLISGKLDDIVPFQHTLDVVKCLEANKCTVRHEAFDCGHMFDLNGKFQLVIALKALGMAREFLEQHVDKAKKACDGLE
jgi:dienelactone hydrolase